MKYDLGVAANNIVAQEVYQAITAPNMILLARYVDQNEREALFIEWYDSIKWPKGVDSGRGIVVDKIAGMNPADMNSYMANILAKGLRYRLSVMA